VRRLLYVLRCVKTDPIAPRKLTLKTYCVNRQNTVVYSCRSLAVEGAFRRRVYFKRKSYSWFWLL